MKVLSNKDDDLLSQFGNINENDITLLERLADLPPQKKIYTTSKKVKR